MAGYFLRQPARGAHHHDGVPLGQEPVHNAGEPGGPALRQPNDGEVSAKRLLLASGLDSCLSLTGLIAKPAPPEAERLDFDGGAPSGPTDDQIDVSVPGQVS